MTSSGPQARGIMPCSPIAAKIGSTCSEDETATESRSAISGRSISSMRRGPWSMPRDRLLVSVRPLPSTPDGSGFFLFGGETAAEFFNDLWSFDFASQTWTLLDDGRRRRRARDMDSAATSMPPIDSSISHGFTFEGRFNDTWAFDTSPERVDRHLSTDPDARPLQRCLHEVVAVDGGNSLLLYAGCSSGYGPCPQGDLWSFDAARTPGHNSLPTSPPRHDRILRSISQRRRNRARGRL